MTTRRIRTEEGQVKLSEKDQLWNNILSFLVGELFGSEVLEKFASHQHRGDPIAKNEKLTEVSLTVFERRIYDCVDLIHTYLRENQYLLPLGELNEKQRVSHALKNLFWGVIKLNHSELQKYDSKDEAIGIRKGYKIVHFKDARPKNFMEIMDRLTSEAADEEEEEE